MKKKKIPTHAEIKAKIAETQKAREEEERQKVLQFLQDKSLKMIFHLALGLESLDYLKATTNYQKDIKLHGNRLLKALERDIEPKIDALYESNPEFSHNMFQQIEKVGEDWSQVLFADYPIICQMKDEFLKDPEYWRKNTIAKFNRLDADLKQDSNEQS